MHNIKTFMLGGEWCAEIQIQIFGDCGMYASWQWGPRGCGSTPEEAIEDAKVKTRASLTAALNGLR